ncbi:Uncharacterised protein [Serratia marcescens]|uniref:hypothetical protein n=1 Tax=Serratia TaxID=613 RepID=UPI0018D87DB5|nr:hypothetical protein [Serratia marcescens]MBH2619096.1 hypothetical protein [Serratia marcescens]CAI1620075.1 Uncharacterised protein [Serratia marcescens]CAI1822808.1 Uncharacterised protein [Serratia marcescens]CAI2041252.1 Uncharacterised protein [Serratia marcescens]HEJ7153577.1 hypothetical protein [Serratia marcescens]
MSRSFAVWGCRNYKDTSKSNYDSTHVNFIDELHINFWSLNSPKQYYLDFGITFRHPGDEDIANNGAVCVYIPFIKSSEDFSDLSHNLDQSRDLVTAVFNEFLISKNNLTERHLEIELANKGSLIINTKLDFSGGELDHRIKTTTMKNGTLLAFKLKHCLSNKNELNTKHYIRFRIKLTENDTKSIVKTFYPKDHFLKSSIERSDIIDFRINEQRNLPNEISTTLASAACTPLKCHLFIIRDITDDCSASGSNYKGSRILESETWGKYFDETVSFGKIDPMIYHWKISNDTKSRLNDFSVAVKFKNTRAKISKVFAYLFYALAITYIMKFLPSDILKDKIFFSVAFVLVALYIMLHFIKYRK